MKETKLSPRALAQLAAVTEGAVRVGLLVALPALLRSFGADPDGVAREAGVDARLLDDPENSIGFAALGRLLALCAARTGCAYLGLLLGQRGGLESLGLIGLIAEHSPDVGTALRNLILHLHLADPELRRLLGECIAALEATGARDLVIQVRRVLHNLLREVAAPWGRWPSFLICTAVPSIAGCASAA